MDHQGRRIEEQEHTDNFLLPNSPSLDKPQPSHIEPLLDWERAGAMARAPAPAPGTAGNGKAGTKPSGRGSAGT
jgi:hypothetical protein